MNLSSTHRAFALCFALLAFPACGDSPSDEPADSSCDTISAPCDSLGDTRCNEDGSSVVQCRADPHGCLVWATQSPCGDYGSCKDAACTCQQECATPDALRCAEDAIQQCRADAAGCLHWEEVTRCADVGKTCEQDGASVVCVGGCDIEGEVRCSGDVLETCSQNAQSFLDWSVVVDCAANEQLCSDAAGIAECINP